MTHYSGVSVRHAKRAFLVQNLLIINLIFVLRNMPRAFFPFTPLSFIHLSLPRSESLFVRHGSHLQWLQSTSSPLTTTAPICLFSLCPALHPFLWPRYTQWRSLFAHKFCTWTQKRAIFKFTQTHNLKGGSSKRQFEASWKHSSRLSSPNSVFVSLSGLFVRWKDYLIVYRFRACLQSICCVYGACCLTMKDYWELLFVCVCLCIWLDNLL